MTSCVKDVLQVLTKEKGSILLSQDELQVKIKNLQKISADEGLSESDIDELVNYLTANKLSASMCNSLLSCLIPKIRVSDNSLKQILLWIFEQITRQNLSIAVVKSCLQWLTGVTLYELVNTSVLEEYYYSFLFLLHKPQLESLICQILCLISKHEDARRWAIQVILNNQRVTGPKAHTNALLSLLKSYHQNVVPENIPMVNFNRKTTPFDENLKKAQQRKLESAEQTSQESSNLEWNNRNFYNDRSKNLTRLIPSASSFMYKSEKNNQTKKLHLLYEFKTISSLGIRPFDVECPAETLSLLQNLGGYHYLAFSDPVTKNRFFTKLFYTLCRVFLLELEPYSEQEKIHFLTSLKQLQEYIQQGISVITVFLFKYLLIWDGERYKEQVLGLIEWLDIKDENDLEEFVFPCLRQIFISSGTHSKCLIIQSLGKLMRNLLIMDKREQSCFQSKFDGCNVVKLIGNISSFVSSLIVNGLIWNKEKNTRNVLMAALDFYDTCQALEQAGDLPIIMIMPPAVVYGCLFSGSRLNIARISSLLLRLLLNSTERLHLLGVFEDFPSEVLILRIYLLDFYQFLWSDLPVRAGEKESFMIQRNIFLEELWKMKKTLGDIVEKSFRIDCNFSFWDPQTRRSPDMVLKRTAEDYPDIVRLKQVIEERVLQVS